MFRGFVQNFFGFVQVTGEDDETSYATESSASSTVTRSGVTCNICGETVGESCYKCPTCNDYNLCASCANNSNAGEIDDSRFYAKHVCIANSQSSNNVPDRSRRESEQQDPGFVCGVCSRTTVGVRHHCLDCSDFDMCSECFEGSRAQTLFPLVDAVDGRGRGESSKSRRDNTGVGSLDAHLSKPSDQPGKSHSPFPLSRFFPGYVPGPQSLPRRTYHFSPKSTYALGIYTGKRSSRSSTPPGERGAAAARPGSCDPSMAEHESSNYLDLDTCDPCSCLTAEQHRLKHNFIEIKNLDFVSPQAKTGVAHNVTCDACKTPITGVRFKCIHPECSDYNLCGNCEALPVRPHPTLHLLVTLRDSLSENPDLKHAVELVQQSIKVSQQQVRRDLVPTRHIEEAALVLEGPPPTRIVERSEIADTHAELPVVSEMDPQHGTASQRLPISPNASPPLTPQSTNHLDRQFDNGELPSQETTSHQSPATPESETSQLVTILPESIDVRPSSPVTTTSIPPPSIVHPQPHSRTHPVLDPLTETPPPSVAPAEAVLHPESQGVGSVPRDRRSPVSLLDYPAPFEQPIDWPDEQTAVIEPSFRHTLSLHSPIPSDLAAPLQTPATPAQNQANDLSPVDQPLAVEAHPTQSPRIQSPPPHSLPKVSHNRTGSTSRTNGSRIPTSSQITPTTPTNDARIGAIDIHDDAEHRKLAHTPVKEKPVIPGSASRIPRAKAKDHASELAGRAVSPLHVNRDRSPSPALAHASSVTTGLATSSGGKRPRPVSQLGTRGNKAKESPSAASETPSASGSTSRVQKPPTVASIPRAPPILPRMSASFVTDNSIRDGQVLLPGTDFLKSWKLKNNGTLPWPAGTGLVSVRGNRLGAPYSLHDVPQGVKPGDVVDVAIVFRAPDEPGRYRSYWRLKDDDSKTFGDRIWCDIDVREAGAHGFRSEKKRRYSVDSSVSQPTVTH